MDIACRIGLKLSSFCNVREVLAAPRIIRVLEIFTRTLVDGTAIYQTANPLG